MTLENVCKSENEVFIDLYSSYTHIMLYEYQYTQYIQIIS